MFYMRHIIDIFCERVFLVYFLNILHAIVKFTLLMLWWFYSRGVVSITMKSVVTMEWGDSESGSRLTPHGMLAGLL